MANSETSEGLHKLYALHFYGRILFAIRLIPLLRAAPNLRRYVGVAAGGYEGTIYPEDFSALALPITKLRGHSASMMSLALEHLATEAPDVSFINAHPGLVITKSLDQVVGIMGVVLRTVAWIFGRWLAVPLDESAQRHVYLSTSEAFKPKDGPAKGMPLVEGVGIHDGTDGQPGSGVYSVKWDGEGPGDKVVALLEVYRKDGTREKVWEHTTAELDKTSMQPS
jgi:hypothetical protein